jgi:hypothetical protein
MAPRRLLVLAAALAATTATRAPSLEAWINDLELIIDEKFEDKISGIKVSVKDIECDDLELGSLTAEYQKGDEDYPVIPLVLDWPCASARGWCFSRSSRSSI